MAITEAAGDMESARLQAENLALRQQVADLRVKEALRKEGAYTQIEARFQLADSIISAVQNLVLVANDRGEATFASPSVYRLFGYSPEEVLGEGWLNLTRRDSEERARVKHYLAAAAKGEVEISPIPYEREMYDKQGNRRWILWQDARGPGNSLIGIGSDITARKQAEEALRESEERHRTIINAALDAVITIDSAGLITGWNRQAEALFGWSHQEALGQPLATTLIPCRYRDAHERGVKHFLATGEGRMLNRRIEIAARHREGHEFPVELTISPIRSEGTWLFSAFVRDITARKRTEEELQQAKETAEAANRAKSEFLATMSHELRTPLGIILGYTDLLLEDTFGQLGEQQTDSLRRIDRSARELLDLITAVLDLSRLEAGRLPLVTQETQVARLLQELQTETQQIQEQTQLLFVWKVEESLPSLYTDPGKLKIVLKNLIGNAGKFTKEGSITVAARNHLGGVEVRVTDTGMGIPQEALGMIFEPFRQIENPATRQYGGTGLGLYIVKRLLELFGATITVESEVGRGSTFRVWLPKGKSTDEHRD
jgi:PAS domain S-box-containing protein